MSTPSSNNAAVESNHNRMDEQESDTFPNHVGYSLVNPATLSDKPLDEIDPPLTIQPPSHLTSLLYTVAEKLSTRHLFLRGPPKSGRSSLVMDLACELAVTTPCRCPDITSADTNSNSCSCIAVTLFLPVAEESNFPLHCQSVSTAFVTNMEYSSSQQSATAFSFPKQLLRRIQIRRVASLEDLLGQLFRMQGVLLPEQPSALLLDDLDRLCGSLSATPNLDRISSPSSGHADATKLHARESLVLATLLDTANCLTRLHQMQTHLYPRKVFVLAATSSSYDDSPSTATSFFVPAMAFVTPASSHWQPLFIKPGGASSPISAGDEDEVVASRWVLQSKDKTAVGEYAILQSLERGWRILWSVKDAV